MRRYSPAPSTSPNFCSATCRQRGLNSGSFSSISSFRTTSGQAASSSCRSATPTRLASRMSVASPTPSVAMTGSPQARYSPSFVGQEATFASVGFTKHRPTSAVANSSGTASGETFVTLRHDDGSPALSAARITRSASLAVRIRNEADCQVAFSRAPKRNISSAR